MNPDSHDPAVPSGWHALLFSLRRSVRYHQSRLMFFDRLNKIIRFVSLLSGVGVITTVLAKMGEPWILVSAIAVALLSTLDLVINSEGAVRRHTELAGRFIDLEKRMIQCPDPSDSALASFTAARLELEAGEPPILRVLDSICHNEVLRAMGYTSHFARIAWYQRLFSQLFDIHHDTISQETV